MFKKLIELWDSHKKDHGVDGEGSLTTNLFLHQVEENEHTENYEKSTVYYIEGRRLYQKPSYILLDNLIFMEGRFSIFDFKILHYIVFLDKKNPSVINSRYDLEMYFLQQHGCLYIPYHMVLEKYCIDSSGVGLSIVSKRWEDLYATAID